jgi:porphobilinogen synthase
MDLPIRPRRLRRSPEIRALVRETTLTPSNLVQPLFVIDGDGKPEPIASMPGQNRLTISQLVEECRELYELGIHGVALFPKLDAKLKDAKGSEALNKKTLILRAVSAVKAAVPRLLIFADIALDPYTTHGHDGVLTKDGSDVDNDATVDILCKMAVLHAEAGVDFVAPSDMMDGRIAAIRNALDASGYEKTESSPTARNSQVPTTDHSGTRSAARKSREPPCMGRIPTS